MNEDNDNIFNTLAQLRDSRKEKSVLIWQGHSLTVSQIEKAARQIAGGLQELGIKAGDRIAVMLPNVPPYVFIKFGVHLMGGILVPIHTLTRGAELGYQLDDCEAKVLITWSGFREVADAAMEHTESLRHRIQISASQEKGMIDFTEWMLNAKSYPGEPVGGGEDIAFIRYTAGVTGRPKGAMITHSNVLYCGKESLRVLKVSSKDRVLGAIPFYHPFGGALQLQMVLEANATLVMQTRFDPQEAYEMISSKEISVFIGLPVHFAGLVETAKEETHCGQLRFAISGGGPLDLEVMNRFESIFSIKIANVYGTCETSPTIAINPAHREDAPRESWGRPISGMDVLIVDIHGNNLPVGRTGEIIVRGPGVFKGYWNRPGATAITMDSEGWFHTEDLGNIDIDGYLYGLGRLHDRINKGGFSVYPREIEGVLNAHPAVKVSAVIGVEDPALGEEIVAYIVPRNDAQVDEKAILQYCSEQLARYKVPKQILTIDQLPRSPNGEILRRALRKPPQSQWDALNITLPQDERQD